MQFTINPMADNSSIQMYVEPRNGIYRMIFCLMEDICISPKAEIRFDTGIRLFTDDPGVVRLIGNTDYTPKDIDDLLNYNPYDRMSNIKHPYEKIWVSNFEFYFSPDRGYSKIMINVKNQTNDVINIECGKQLGFIQSCDGHFDYVMRNKQ